LNLSMLRVPFVSALVVTVTFDYVTCATWSTTAPFSPATLSTELAPAASTPFLSFNALSANLYCAITACDV
jgi:hypothetical protein